MKKLKAFNKATEEALGRYLSRFSRKQVWAAAAVIFTVNTLLANYLPGYREYYFSGLGAILTGGLIGSSFYYKLKA